MTYKALYRTYRPQKFTEVVGQDHIVRTLQNSIANNKISHAYLFSGPRGTGKTSVARIFAKALNCANPIGMEPCGVCTSCKEIVEGMSPDVVEIDAASNNGVDEIREIREKVKFLPGGNKYKIYIIDEVHMLSAGAFNALLKTLEEPPTHVIFILATTEPHKVLPTILSRCQRFDFKTLSVKEIADVVRSVSEKEGFGISEEAVLAIAEGAEGGMRDALSYLDQAASFTDDVITIDDVNSVTGNLNFDKIVELAKYFEEKKITESLKTVHDLVIMGKETSKIITSLLQFYRDCLLYKNIDVTQFAKYIFEKEDFKNIATNTSLDQIFYYIDVLSEVQVKIKTSTTPMIHLEVAIIKMINSSADDFMFNKKLKELEAKLEGIAVNGISVDATPVDDNRVEGIEAKLNRVVAELSKLELHKLAQRIETIETQSFNVAPSSFNNEELKELKEQISNIEDRLDTPVVAANPDFSEELASINQELTNLKATREMLKTEPKEAVIKETIKEVVPNQDLEKIANAIENIQDEVELLKANRLQLDKVEKILNSTIEHAKPQTNDYKYDINIIKDKLTNIETKVYKIIAGELEKKEVRKTKTKTSRKQIELFGEDLISIEDIHQLEFASEPAEVEEEVIQEKFEPAPKKPVELEVSEEFDSESEVEETEFEDFEFDEEDDFVLDDAEEEMVESEAKPEVELEVSKELEEQVENLDELDESEEDPEDIFAVFEQEKLDIKDEPSVELVEASEELEEESTLDLLKKLRDEQINQAENLVIEEIEEDSTREVLEKLREEEILKDFGSKLEELKKPAPEERSTLVRTTREEQLAKPASDGVAIGKNYDYLRDEKEEVKVEASDFPEKDSNLIKTVEEKQAARLVEVRSSVVINEDIDDEFSRYDVKALERILHESRTDAAMIDRERLNNLWRRISQSVPSSQQHIASLLQSGKLVVVGKKEFVITYPNVAICNQVMRESFKKESLKILYDFLGDIYNYMALPEEVWLEKRAEYRNQYTIGTKFPKLTPIQVEGLSVVEENKEYIEKQGASKRKAISIFGADLVE